MSTMQTTALMRLPLVFLWLVVVVVVAQVPGAAGQSGCITNTTYPYRLPLSVIPQHYKLFLNVSDPSDNVLTYEVPVNDLANFPVLTKINGPIR